jgi:hypothetical protein
MPCCGGYTRFFTDNITTQQKLFCFVLLCFVGCGNILTRLDELLVLNSTIFVCVQCSICLFSLLCKARNDFLYLAFYVVLYGSLVIGFGVTIGLSCSRVLIIISVSNT